MTSKGDAPSYHLDRTLKVYLGLKQTTQIEKQHRHIPETAGANTSAQQSDFPSAILIEAFQACSSAAAMTTTNQDLTPENRVLNSEMREHIIMG